MTIYFVLLIKGKIRQQTLHMLKLYHQVDQLCILETKEALVSILVELLN